MPELAEFRDSLDGEWFSPDSSGYEAIRRPVNLAYQEVRPRLVVRCRSVSDVVGAMTYATATGDRIVPRGGGHCFAGRSSTDGIVLDMSGLDGISVGRSFFHELAEHVHLRLLEAVPAPGVTHLRYEVVR